MSDAEDHRSKAAALRTQMKGERSDARLRELERQAAVHDRLADEAEKAENGDSGADMLIDGQEEVFSRAEVELGDVEHKAETR